MAWDYTLDRKHFSSRLLEPEAWISRADDLLEAAEKLEADAQSQVERMLGPDFHKKRDWYSEGPFPTYFMLVAFALENLLKAALIRRDKENLGREIKDSGTFPARLKTHDLSRLMSEFGIAPKDRINENRIRRLTRAAKWFGRYPVPTTVKEFNVERYADGGEASVWLMSTDDVTRLKQLISDVRSRLNV